MMVQQTGFASGVVRWLLSDKAQASSPTASAAGNALAAMSTGERPGAISSYEDVTRKEANQPHAIVRARSLPLFIFIPVWLTQVTAQRFSARCPEVETRKA